jgi:Holliday junction resolvase RusA-like endonuclease
MLVTVRHFVIIPGQPVAKGRPRFDRRGHAYTPEKTVRWEQMAAMQIRAAIGSPMYDQPLKLQVTAYFERPKRLLTRKASSNRIHHTSKPDADNIGKIVADVLTMAGVVRDDSIINQMLVTKYYAAKDAPAEVVILLDSWENEMAPTDTIKRRNRALEKKTA